MAKNTETKNLSDDLTIIEIDEEAGEVLVDRSGRPCGPKARFAPGMDARTKGTLQTAFRLGFNIRHVGQGVTKSAQEWAKDYGYERFLTAKPKRRRSNAPKFTSVKVGRHWYDIDKITGSKTDGFEVTYTTAKGETKTVSIPVEKMANLA